MQLTGSDAYDADLVDGCLEVFAEHIVWEPADDLSCLLALVSVNNAYSVHIWDDVGLRILINVLQFRATDLQANPAVLHTLQSFLQHHQQSRGANADGEIQHPTNPSTDKNSELIISAAVRKHLSVQPS